MHTLVSTTARLGLAAALLAGSAVAAQAHTRIGIDIGLPIYDSTWSGGPGGSVSVGWGRGPHYWYRGGFWYGPWAPGYIVVAPQYAYPVPAAPPDPALAAAPSPPDPVIYPRSGQDAAQTELDRQACNRWAVTQPSAVADASVFQRAVQACMDGRGYTIR